MSLINHCICGNSTEFQSFKKYHIPLAHCRNCQVVHQRVDMTEQQYVEFYTNDYHDEHQRSIGAQPYQERYTHDCKIADIRLDKYSTFTPGKGKWLDIGSGNGALVDRARARGYDAYGVDFFEHPWTYKGPVEDVNFPTEHFDVITMHDVLEHLVDPVKTLKEVRRILKPGGRLIVDFPNYFVEAGLHHWRKIQHLWYLDEKQLLKLLEQQGFNTTEVDHPIPGKFVAYSFNVKSVASEKKILLLPGMGDIYWTMTKMESFLKKKGLVMPQAYVWDFDGRPRSKEFLQKFPFLKTIGYHTSAPDPKILDDTYVNNRAWLVEKYSGFDYYLSVNGLLVQGESLESIKDYKTNWYVPMFESIESKNFGKAFQKEHGDYLVVFFSGHGMFEHWIKSIPPKEMYGMLKKIAKDTGLKIVLTGLKWDMPANLELMALDKTSKIFINLVDQTPNDQFFGLVKASKGFIGWCGGNTILSAIFKKPTIMLWSTTQFKKEGFFKNCVPPESLENWYFPRIVGQDSTASLAGLAAEKFR